MSCGCVRRSGQAMTEAPHLISLPTQPVIVAPRHIQGPPCCLSHLVEEPNSGLCVIEVSERTCPPHCIHFVLHFTAFCFVCLYDRLLSRYKSEYFRCCTCRRSGWWLFSTPLLCLMCASWTSPPQWFTGAHAADRELRYRSLSHQASCRGLGGRTLSLHPLSLLSVSHPSFRLYSR